MDTDPNTNSITGKLGAAPGALIHVGVETNTDIRITAIEFDRRELREYACPVEQLRAVCRAARESEPVTWINIDGISDAGIVKTVTDALELHPLTGEDIMNASQRAKAEEFDHYWFLALKMAHVEGATTATDSAANMQSAKSAIWFEHLSLIASGGVIVTFQARTGDVFEPLRERIRTTRGQVRSRGLDYLAYALVDAVLDHYFAAIEAVSDRIEIAEDRMLAEDTDALADIHNVKRDLIHLRRAVQPMREVIVSMRDEWSDFISEKTRVYLSDVNDHSVQVLELIDTLRDLIASIRDHQMTVISTRMNQVMKVLSVIGTIFLPLTFIAGVYGMNFAMPEYEIPWGYAAIWGVMVVTSVVLLLIFRRKKWL